MFSILWSSFIRFFVYVKFSHFNLATKNAKIEIVCDLSLCREGWRPLCTRNSIGKSLVNSILLTSGEAFSSITTLNCTLFLVDFWVIIFYNFFCHSEQILNPSVPMALRLSGILMGMLRKPMTVSNCVTASVWISNRQFYLRWSSHCLRTKSETPLRYELSWLRHHFFEFHVNLFEFYSYFPLRCCFNFSFSFNAEDVTRLMVVTLVFDPNQLILFLCSVFIKFNISLSFNLWRLHNVWFGISRCKSMKLGRSKQLLILRYFQRVNCKPSE